MTDWAKFARSALQAVLRRPSPAPSAPPGTSRPGEEPSAGELVISYEPHPDGVADPGEIVWTWVAYEDDASQGKDRPVVVIGRAGHLLATLMLTSKDHDRDEADEAHWGRYWMDIGSGGWDSSGRSSEVRLDRLILVDPTDVRREGATLDEQRFEAVVAAARPHLGV